MVGKVGSEGSGEFPIGDREEGPSLDKLSDNSSKVGKFVTSRTQKQTGYTLKGHVTPDFKAPDYLSNMKKKLK